MPPRPGGHADNSDSVKLAVHKRDMNRRSKTDRADFLRRFAPHSPMSDYKRCANYGLMLADKLA
ncbi:hypothetical protein NCCP2495_34340 [Dietzia sp. NCCP-2495]|nr:hypothetical protein NCCP2495_34340 [Dietzia sp. NCCP-2495]